MSFNAQVTATDSPTLLTLADGDAATRLQARAPRHRRQAPAARRWRRASARRRSRRSTAPVDPLLTRWNDAVTRQKATVKLRQKVKGKATGNYRKVVLVTLSTETP